MPAVRFAKPGEGRSMIEVCWRGEAVQVWSERKQRNKRQKRNVIVAIRRRTHLAGCLHVSVDHSIQIEGSIDPSRTMDRFPSFAHRTRMLPDRIHWAG